MLFRYNKTIVKAHEAYGILIWSKNTILLLKQEKAQKV